MRRTIGNGPVTEGTTPHPTERLAGPSALWRLRATAVVSCLSGSFLMVGWTLNIGRDSLLGAHLVLAAYVLAGFSFTGLYAAQRRRFGWTGFVAYVLLVVGCALFVSFLFVDIARISGAAPEAQWQVIERGGGPTQNLGVVGALAFVFGFVLWAVASLRARTLSRWPAWVLAAAGIAPLLYTWIPIGKLLPRLGGLALVGFGLSLWARSAALAGNHPD